MTKGVDYAHANNTIRREQPILTVAGNGTVGARFAHFQKVRLKAAHAIVVTAGTSTSPGSALTLKNGTTSIGLLATGTVVAGGTVSALALNSDLSSLVVASATNGTDATGVALVVWEYEVLPDSVMND